MVNVVTFSSLYPNSVDPSHGLFVERRLLRLAAFDDIDSSVVAPVPWFPFRAKIFGRYADLASVPASETRNGILVKHPRYRLLPKIGMMSAPTNMASATRRVVEQLIGARRSDTLIDAHYFYPDGVAAASVAADLGVPYCITARGSDINLIGTMPKPREMMRAAARNAGAVIAVSQALADALADLGIAQDNVHVLRNGVDLEFFEPGDRDGARRALGFEGTTFLSVGTLKEEKGHHIAIEALGNLSDASLVIAGAGQYEQQLRNSVRSLGLSSRVRFAGILDPEQLRRHYQAADALFLASAREGMPNVVLESLACGTPVVASRVGGIPEVVSSPVMGELMRCRTAGALIEAWRALERRGIDRHAIRNRALALSWDSTIGTLRDLMLDLAGGSR